MKRRAAACSVLLALTGCASTRGALLRTPVEPPSSGPARGPVELALVLSGGAVRGFAHIGVLRVLEQSGLVPELVVGTSAGAIVGALWASGQSAAQIEALAVELDFAMLFDVEPWKWVTQGVGLGLARGDRLENFLRRAIAGPMQLFPLPFAAVATDLHAAQAVTLNHGDAALAVRASSSVPGLYEPVSLGGRLLADGQIVSPLPVQAARRLGARRVVAVDVVWPPQQAQLSNPVSVLLQTMAVSTWELLQQERALADLVLTPLLPQTSGQMALADGPALVAAGEAAARQALPALRALHGWRSKAGTGPQGSSAARAG